MARTFTQCYRFQKTPSLFQSRFSARGEALRRASEVSGQGGGNMVEQRGPFWHPRASEPSLFLLSICILVLGLKGHNNRAHGTRPGCLGSFAHSSHVVKSSFTSVFVIQPSPLFRVTHFQPPELSWVRSSHFAPACSEFDFPNSFTDGSTSQPRRTVRWSPPDAACCEPFPTNSDLSRPGKVLDISETSNETK